MSELITGTVTFLFTDIEGSTRLLASLGDGYANVLADHDRILRAAIADAGGHVVDTQGDAFFAAFPRARDAVAAAVAAQHELDGVVPVRMGIHTGEPSVGPDRYVGLGVHRASRICSAAHGGQVLLSGATREIVEDDLPRGARLRDLGAHRLKDLDRPEHLYQLDVEGHRPRFPPLRSAPRRDRRWAFAALPVAIAGVVAGVLFLGSGTAAVVVPANSVAVIDVARNRVSAAIPLSSLPGAISAAGSGVWVTSAIDGNVTQIDPRRLAVTRTFGVGGAATDVAANATGAWVVTGPDQTVVHIDARKGVVLTRNLHAGRTPAGSVALAADGVWVGTADLLKLDPATGAVLERVLGGRVVRHPFFPIDSVTDHGHTWVADVWERLTELNARTARPILQRKLPAHEMQIAAGDGVVWIAGIETWSAGTPTVVWRIDEQTAETTAQVRLGHSGALAAIAYGAGSVWTMNRGDRTVSRLDPVTGRVVATIAVGRPPAGIAVFGSRVFVSVD
jgi:YVTN family beta-propeller protein